VRYTDYTQRIKLEFGAYVKEDFGAEPFAQRRPSTFDRLSDNEVPLDDGVHSFSS
jgi:hypothetical protein